MVISDGEDGGGDEVGGGVLVQAQPFTGQLADEEQADQGVAELEPRVAFHKIIFFPAQALPACGWEGGSGYQLSD